MKNLLIIKASSDICGTEIEQLEKIADLLEIDHSHEELTAIDTFKEALPVSPKFDYIYLAAHANTESFGESDGSIVFQWNELATAFCEANCLKPGAILLLGCCRGGLKQVAMKLFVACDQIDYVCGPRWKVRPPDIATGFHVFLYNMETRREQPSTAVKRASRGTGYDFFCHDRIEMENEIASYGVDLMPPPTGEV